MLQKIKNLFSGDLVQADGYNDRQSQRYEKVLLSPQ